jgi:hypothetical protein
MGIISWILRWLTLARVPNRAYPLLDTGNRLSQLGIPLIVWLLATCAFAQNSRFESVALGPKGPIPFALVAVCTQPTNTSAQPCSPTANLCSSLSDTICTSPNPLTSDSLGHYHFYIKQAQSPFTVQIYGPQVESPLVLPDQSAGVSTGSITKFTNPGIFSRTGYQSYLSSNINAFTPSSFSTISLPNVLDAISGGVVIPVGANVGPNAEGIAGYAVNKADTRSGAPGAPTGTAGFQSNGVSLYGISQAYNNFSSAWGINTTTADNTSTANTFLVGYEADMWVLGTPFVLYGMDVTLNGNTGTVPGGSFGYNISNSRTDGGKFTIGFDANDNCCATALSVGPSGPSGPSVASQNVSWCRYDSGSVRHCDDFIMEDATGNLDVNTATGKGVILSNGTLIGSGTAGNTDLNGQLKFSASTTSNSYSFTGTYTSAPICTITPLADPIGRLYVSTLNTTTLQLTDTSPVTITVNYQCSKRN